MIRRTVPVILLLQTISTTRGEATSGNALKVEAKNYYDDYSFRQEISQLFPEWADSINAVYASPMVARGRLTATLRYTSKTKGHFEMYRYDSNGRMTYKLSAYHNKWMKIMHTAYNFVGDVVTEEESVYTYSDTHISFLAGRRTVNTFHSGTRLLANTTVTHTDKNNNTSTQTVNNPTYDVFGNVVADNRPGTAADMTYTYDTLHGWLTGISSPCGFSEQLQRETATNEQYNGNIGRMLWRNTANGEQHRYDYTYDTLGRLTCSQYSSSFNGTAGRFNETVTYNPNGAITSLVRNGMKNDGTFGAIDSLAITYDGNRLKKVTDYAETLNYNGALDFDDGDDSTTEYHYDSNGALTYDSNRGITSISYDYCHYPSHIARAIIKRKHVYNDYTTDGRKLHSQHISYIPKGTGTYYRIIITDHYIDGLILRGDTSLLWKFSGGYVELNANSTPTSWNYYITDHLGSTRMVVDSNNNIKETINYYPFGSEMKMEDPALLTGGASHPYRFTGKELDKVNNLNMYDFGARWYDVAGVPMWTSVDPLAEKYYSFTPYSYCAGDPVNMIDPDGRDWFSSLDPVGSDNGQTIWKTQIHYTDQTSQEQLDKNNINGTYLGKTVVLFDGYYDERLGKDNTLDGPESKHATATVYGANGPEDITQYTAFTMTSNFDKYGAIQDGIYDGSYAGNNKPNHIPKPYVLENGGAINTVDGNRYENGYSKDQKNGIFIHRTNNNGTANGSVSIGCLLIKAQQMANFEKHVGRKPFKVILRRK